MNDSPTTSTVFPDEQWQRAEPGHVGLSGERRFLRKALDACED